MKCAAEVDAGTALASPHASVTQSPPRFSTERDNLKRTESFKKCIATELAAHYHD